MQVLAMGGTPRLLLREHCSTPETRHCAVAPPESTQRNTAQPPNLGVARAASDGLSDAEDTTRACASARHS